MNELTKRVLLVFISIPLLLVVILYLTFGHYILFSLIVTLFSYLGTIEFILLSMQIKKRTKWMYTFGLLGITFPVLAYLKSTGLISRDLSEAFFVLVAGSILLTEFINFERGKATRSIARLTTGMTAILYPGLFLSYLLKLIRLPHTPGLTVFFLLVVFTNDTAAYVFGLLFGRKSWKPFISSPKKSIVGYVSGSLTAVVAGIFFGYAYPEVIPVPLWGIGIFALLLSLTADIGDLIESVLKRSAHVKDSGKLMLGRGGVLDSIDSILLSAPLYYFLLTILLK